MHTALSQLLPNTQLTSKANTTQRLQIKQEPHFGHHTSYIRITPPPDTKLLQQRHHSITVNVRITPHQRPTYCNKAAIQSLSTYASLHIRDQLIETKPPFNHCQRTHHSTSEKTKATKPPINHCQQSVTINTTGAKSLLRPEQGCVRWRPVEGETSYS